eukprot:gene12119-14178_t
MSVNITRSPWIENYYVGDGLETLFGKKMASAFAKCPTPTEIRPIKQLKISQQTVTNQDDYTRALNANVTASASILGWGLSGETKNSFTYGREINTNTTHFLINNCFIKNETVFTREQLDDLVFAPAALKLLKEKKFDEFKSQYGDSYIVGYATGGFYNGDICIESYKDKYTTDMQAQLSASFSNVAFKADGATDFTNKLTTYSSNYKITVTIQGTGIALKQISIGDINKNAGNIESLGDTRLYAIVASYDDLPQFKEVVPATPKVDLQPKVKQDVAKAMNELYFDVQYAVNSKKYFSEYFSKMIKNSAELTAANTKLNNIVTKIGKFMNQFDTLTVDIVESISLDPKANKKWQSILEVKPVMASLYDLPATVGIVKIGTAKEREILLAKARLLNQYNTSGWDKSPSQYVITIVTNLKVDTNPLIDFYCEYFTRTNTHMGVPIAPGQRPDTWSTNDERITTPTSSMIQSLDEIYITNTERAAVKVHIDELQKENDVNTATSPWNGGQSGWLNSWIRRCSPSISCGFFMNLVWFMNTINDTKQWQWSTKGPDALIAKFCLAAKFIYKMK